MTDVDAYRAQGYVLLKGLFPADEIERIHAEAKQVFARQIVQRGLSATEDMPEPEFEDAMARLFQEDLPTFTNCGKQAQHLISLHRLSLDERIVDKLRELGLSWPNVSTRPVLYFNSERLAKKEVYWRLDVHQDWRSMQGSLDSVVVWIPLIDIDEKLGALEVIPESHLWGLLEADMEDGYGHVQGDVDESQFIPVEVERGDALFFSSFLVHRSGTNVTDSIRWSCHFRYNNLAERTFLERGYPHPYIYKPQEELITPRFPSRSDVGEVFAARDTIAR
jgi:Phytanoyl-CoA dioxygenase (PhyH)